MQELTFVFGLLELSKAHNKSKSLDIGLWLLKALCIHLPIFLLPLVSLPQCIGLLPHLLNLQIVTLTCYGIHESAPSFRFCFSPYPVPVLN